jgi:hypothetical protein
VSAELGTGELTVARAVRIDLTHRLPPRPQPLTGDSLAQVFGGCIQEWQSCENNWDCCSNKCNYRVYIPSQNRILWECLPEWATGK